MVSEVLGPDRFGRRGQGGPGVLGTGKVSLDLRAAKAVGQGVVLGVSPFRDLLCQTGKDTADRLIAVEGRSFASKIGVIVRFLQCRERVVPLHHVDLGFLAGQHKLDEITRRPRSVAAVSG